jgi:hypothetical protein
MNEYRYRSGAGSQVIIVSYKIDGAVDAPEIKVSGVVPFNSVRSNAGTAIGLVQHPLGTISCGDPCAEINAWMYAFSDKDVMPGTGAGPSRL